jgi:SAM-dependent methyltransferase
MSRDQDERHEATRDGGRARYAPTRRFSDRVEDYVRYRPDYPAGLIDYLVDEVGLEPGAVVADLGSGTGLLARPFLERGMVVYGVEPNEPMRSAGEHELVTFEVFHSVAGSAEDTGLPDASVALATAGQSFHWFEPEPVRRELIRILVPGGRAAIVWNVRRLDSTPFLAGYEALLERWAPEYEAVRSLYGARDALEVLFGPAGWREACFEHEQRFEWEGLRGRVLSSSYTPPAGHPDRPGMLEDLRALFERHASRGEVRFEYDTHVYLGEPAAGA